jgi:hypothetical protein
MVEIMELDTSAIALENHPRPKPLLSMRRLFKL